MSVIPERTDIPTEHKWNLSTLYTDAALWDGDLKTLADYNERIESYRGRLAESAAVLREYLDLSVEVGLLEERLGYYAMLRQSEDAGDGANQDRYGRFMQVAAKIGATMSFFAPELQQIPAERMGALLEDPSLSEYRIALEKVLRYRPHTLSPSEERLLALQEEAAQTASNSFRALVDVDLDFGTVETPEGARPLSQSSFGSLQEHRDRDVRERSFTQFYDYFDAHKNTLAALLAGSVQLDVYRARVRNFTSALQARLFPDRVPVAVYESLVDTVREHLPHLHRYYGIRRRALGLDTLAVWDTKPALVPDVKIHTPYETAVATVSEALTPLGDQYVETLLSGLLGGWVDRYENKGKRSGAFSAGSFAGDPYILLNYKEDTLRDVFTLAHEAGHSMHSWYSVRHNPFQHYNYTIFEAEVASTFNEQLLMEHMLTSTNDAAMRAYLITKHIDDILATLFRQTMFAEYERTIHAMVESGQALTVDSLRLRYRELIEAYFGPDVHLPETLDLEGMRIPHFYRAFYVYKYATGISAAITLAQGVLRGGTKERADYFTFLKSGGSRYPIDALRVAGVDTETAAPIRTAMDVFRNRLDQLEEALGI
ncbi:MAG: oligoendopeptidase F [Spirochaetales bacterium]|nr:oligoendopeptidase F [Spirochaetales bacterium]